MSSLSKQLVHAYRREQKLYVQIRDLVNQQVDVMETAPDPRSVLELCAAIERLMAEITAVEEAIQPVKRQWEKTRDDPDGELNAVLSSVEGLIGEVSRAQERVQDGLLEYMQQQKQRTESARKSINVSRARRLYRAG